MLARTAVMVARRFHVPFSQPQLSGIPRQMGFSVPGSHASVHRAGRGAGAGVTEGDVGARGKKVRGQDAWLVFEDESGQALRPPKARTWSRIGVSPQVKMSGRVSVVGIVCAKPDQRSPRFIWCACDAECSAAGHVPVHSSDNTFFV